MLFCGKFDESHKSINTLDSTTDLFTLIFGHPTLCVHSAKDPLGL